MDVRCAHCQSEYEVDDRIVSDLGTEVQCSDCGHMCVVKRPISAALPANASREPKDENAGTWVIETGAGLLLRVRDLTTLHKWIIERRVGREGRLSRDGDPWQRLGDMVELAPFFDIVDSAERARSADMPVPAPMSASLPAPLAVPALEPPVPLPRSPLPGLNTFQPAGAPAASAPRPASAKAQAAAANAELPTDSFDDSSETAIAGREIAKRHGFLKFGITALVAGVVASAGILWQHHRLTSAMISSSRTNESSGAPNTLVAALRTPTPSAAQNAEAAQESAERAGANVHGPVVEPIADAGPSEKVPLLGTGTKHAVPVRHAAGHKARTPMPATGRARGSQASAAKPGAPQTLAAQGYVALNHHQPSRAIALFKRALASNPNNGTALFGLAEAHRAANQIPLAVQAYRRYIELQPSGPDAGSARYQIRILDAKKR
jgi:predicted Zn finger-like uncharacterized protein